jgi:transposase-like protein
VGAALHPLLVDAARFGRHRVGDRWHVDETYVKVAGRWVYLYRAVDQFGQVIDVYASSRRDSEAAGRFFERARTATGVVPSEVITDRAPTYPRILDRLWPIAWHHSEQYANNRIEADHAQLKRRLRAMRGIKTAGSGGQRNTSASACDGVLNARVCRGRSLSSWAMASRSAWLRVRKSSRLGRY